MKDYSQGKIYVLRTPSGLQYVGSTTSTLGIRLSNHRSSYDAWVDGRAACWTSSFLLFDDAGNDVVIELLEDYPCASDKELRRQEGHWQQTIQGGCVNMRIAGRTFGEYRETNKVREHERVMMWRENNRDRYLAYIANYTIANKERIRARQAQRFKCECGADVRRNEVSKHRRALKHLNFVARRHRLQKLFQYFKKQ